MTLSDADAIFLALSEVDPGDRASFLDARCGDNHALRYEVEALLSSLDAPHESFLDPEQIPALDMAALDMAALDGPLQPGTHLGGFLVLRALGSGGMGVVYAAQQDRPRRTVAIKVLRRGYRHPEILRRFEQEAEMLGRLQHPGIAQVFAFSPGDSATPAHLVMELVSGPSLTDFARAEALRVPERVRLFVKLAHAVQHAHERGVIHRDLKPANVLVADGGQPKVLDFGIARATGADVQRMTMQTAHGQLMGTLAYMSPEQLRGRPADVDARSDVYALGRSALSIAHRTSAVRPGTSDLARSDPVRARTDPPRIGSINEALAGPLEEIVAGAMARAIDRRYQTAAHLALDLERFLEGDRPVAAPAMARTSPDVGRPLLSPREDWAMTIDGARTIASDPAGRFVAVGLTSGSIELRDTAAGALVAPLDERRCPVTAIAFLADQRVVAAWEDGHVAALTLRAADR